MRVEELGLSKTTDPDLFLRKLKDDFNHISDLAVAVGIPKEYTTHDFRSERQKQKETDRFKMAKAIVNKNLKKSDEIYLADIAFKNNFGSYAEKIPARPFGSTLLTRYGEKIENLVHKEFLEYFKGRQNLATTYNRIGLVVSGYMKDNLTNGNWKPNSPLTVFLKGSSKPLIDTGQMRQAITYIVKQREW
jgi:hypothetical protein